MHGGWRHEPPTTLNKVPSLRRSPQHPLRHLRQSCSRIVGTMANVTPARAGVFVFVGLFLVAASLMLQHYNDSPSAAAAAAAGLRRSLLSNVDDDLDSITLWVKYLLEKFWYIRILSLSFHFNRTYLSLITCNLTRPPWADQNLVSVSQRPHHSVDETPLFWRKWLLLLFIATPMYGCMDVCSIPHSFVTYFCGNQTFRRAEEPLPKRYMNAWV